MFFVERLLPRGERGRMVANFSSHAPRAWTKPLFVCLVLAGIALLPISFLRAAPLSRQVKVERLGRLAPADGKRVHHTPFISYSGKTAVHVGKARRRYSIHANGRRVGTYLDLSWEQGRWRGPVFAYGKDAFVFAARRRDGWYMVVNGREYHGPHESITMLGIDAYGRRTAFVTKKGDKQVAVVDGKPTRIHDRISNFAFATRGLALAYVARDGKKEFVVMDGKEGPRFDSIRGFRLNAYGLVHAYFGRLYDVEQIVWNGLRTVADGDVRGARLSSDGLLFGYTVRSPSGACSYYFNLLPGREYEQCGPQFVPDARGNRGYIAKIGKQWHVVVNGLPGPGFDWIRTARDSSGRPILFQRGGRDAYIGFKKATGRKSAREVLMHFDARRGKHVSFFEGEKLRLWRRRLGGIVSTRSFEFSSFIARRGNSERLNYLGRWSSPYASIDLPNEDSEGTAYVFRGKTNRGYYIDGSFGRFGPYSYPTDPVVYPRGRVVAWLNYSGKQRRGGVRVMVNGRKGRRWDAIVPGQDGRWAFFEKENRLVYYAVRRGVLYRVRETIKH